MKWKNIRMRGKFTLAIGSIILLMLFILILATTGITIVADKADEVIRGDELQSLLEEKYNQHLLWAKKLNTYVTSPDNTELNVETDPHKCAFGMWYYGEGRKHVESLIPGLIPLIASMESPHINLHKSAIDIDEILVKADYRVSNMLQEAKAEHILWLSTVADALQGDRNLSRSFPDAELCSYGRWFKWDEMEQVTNRSPEISKLLDQLKDEHQNLHNSVIQLTRLARSNALAASNQYRNGALPKLNDVISKTNDIITWNNHHLEGMKLAQNIYFEVTEANLDTLGRQFNALIKESDKYLLQESAILTSARNIRTGIIAFGLFTALLAILLAIVFTRSISIPLKKGIVFAGEVAAGDLNARVAIDQEDEIGNLASSLKGMVSQLSTIVKTIYGSAENIAASSQHLRVASRQISDGANEQASSVEQISSSIEQMAANIEQNTENAQLTGNLAHSVNTRIRESNTATQELVLSMKRITEKISLINDIAFQTNLLALNAAIEAARAGEHGRGFAVVASEVRKLAEHSKAAADEIVLVSAEGMAIADRAGKQLEELVPEIAKTTQLLQEIVSASVEQNAGAGQINNAVQQLNTITQRNASHSEEMASGAEELATLAEKLKVAMGWFRLEGINTANKVSAPKQVKKFNVTPPSEQRKKKNFEMNLINENRSDAEFEKF